MPIIRDFLDSQFLSDKLINVGIGGFNTYARITEKITRSSSIPTTYLEDGTHINDHIIRDPLQLTIEGSVSDIYRKPSEILEAIRRIQREIGNIEQYIPERTQAQISKINAIINDFTNAVDKIDNVIDAGKQLSGFLGLYNSNSKKNTQRFIDEMEANYYTNHLISIDMPYKTYKNMRITLLEIEKDNQNEALSFRLEAQQMRFADRLFSLVSIASNPSSGLNGAVDNLVDKGVQSGTSVSRSTLKELSKATVNLFRR